MKKYIYIIIVIAIGLGFSSCNKFLDEIPDNRVFLKDENALKKALVSAYPSNSGALVQEALTDNLASVHETSSYISGKLIDELFHFQDVTDEGNDSPKVCWDSYWNGIYVCTDVLGRLEQFKNISKVDRDAIEGEARILRAYCYFSLVNIFCQAYDENYSDADLGLPIMVTKPKNITEKLPRASLSETYAQIDKDIQAGIEKVGDNYNVPLYHFTKASSYAFAARFYLNYHKWDKVVEYTNRLFDKGVERYLTNWDLISNYPTDNFNIKCELFASSKNKGVLMLGTVYSRLCQFAGLTVYNLKYNHTRRINDNETIDAKNVPYSFQDPKDKLFKINDKYGAKVIPHKVPTQWEITDPVAQTGYLHSSLALFTGEEALLSRAEAYINLGKYKEALDDMKLYINSYYKNVPDFQESDILTWFKKCPYWTVEKPTIKTKLNPTFDLSGDKEKQEAYLQLCLHLRRVESLYTGGRWLDIKRYGIEVSRYKVFLKENGRVEDLNEKLKVRDPRRAVQLPETVIAAGTEKNPR